LQESDRCDLPEKPLKKELEIFPGEDRLSEKTSLMNTRLGLPPDLSTGHNAGQLNDLKPTGFRLWRFDPCRVT
jgi:hypothetical protein